MKYLLPLLLSGCSWLDAAPVAKTALEIAKAVIIHEFADRGIIPDTDKAICFDEVDVTGHEDASGLVCYIPEAQ